MQYSNSEKNLTEQKAWQEWQCSFFHDIKIYIYILCMFSKTSDTCNICYLICKLG